MSIDDDRDRVRHRNGDDRNDQENMNDGDIKTIETKWTVESYSGTKSSALLFRSIRSGSKTLLIFYSVGVTILPVIRMASRTPMLTA